MANSKSLISKIPKYLRGAKGALMANIALGVGRICCSLLFVWASKWVVDIATGASSDNLNVAIAILVSSSIMTIVFGFFSLRLDQLNAIKIQNRTRTSLFSHFLSIKWMDQRKMHSADILGRMEKDINDLSSTISKALPSFIVTSIQFLASFIFLAMLDSRLAWVVVFVVPIFTVVSKVFYKKQKSLTHNVRKTEARVSSHVQDSILNSLVIRTLGATDAIGGQLTYLHKFLFSKVKSQTNLSSISRAVVSLGFSVGYVAVFIYGIYQLKDGIITYGVLIAFLQLVSQIQLPVSQLATLLPQFITAATALERIEELFAIEKAPDVAPPLEGGCGINVKNISFAYQGRENIIENLSYTFKPKSRCAIVGITGAGKSTLLKILLGLLEPQNGEVEIYNEKQRIKVSTSTISNFVYVPQNNGLFSGTIKENMLLGNNKATEKEIEDALYTAAAEFVYQLPEGLDTSCGEKGDALSQGQAQRVSIARSLLGKGSILLLDEATSALDKETREKVFNRLKQNFDNKTIIFVTHQQEVVDLCDSTLTIKGTSNNSPQSLVSDYNY